MYLLDDQNSHGEDELEFTEDEILDTETDDEETPEDTETTDEPKKGTADEARERQKLAWARDIKAGKKTLDDMPKSLQWLKADVKKELGVEEPKPDEIDARVRKTMAEERAQAEFDLLVEDLQEIDAETEAQLKEEYEGLLSEYEKPTSSQRLKALNIARRLVGIKDSKTLISERRRQGMVLPPSGSRIRKVVPKDGMTEIERKLSGGLPNGYKA